MITAEITVGQLVAERPSRSRIFDRYGIDYCCGGKKPLAEACAEKGLAVEAVVRELDAAERSSPGNATDWTQASLTELADHIEAKHHAWLRTELPRLEFMVDKVARAHGERHPEMLEVQQVFRSLRDELAMHMAKEEQVLFPFVRQMEASDQMPMFHCGSVSAPISVMEDEHQHAGDALARMRALTKDYTPPENACNTFRALLDGLRELEEDMHQHIHKENNILFPAAQALEARLLASSTA